MPNISPWPLAERFGKGFRAFKVRNYRYYWISGLGMTGVQGITQLSLAWLVLDLTESVGQLGIVIFMQGVAWSVIALLGGVLADRYSRRALLIASQLFTFGSLVTIAALTLAEMVQAWQVYVSALIFGMTQALTMPARTAILRSLVDDVDIMNAVALNSMQQHSARVLWPSLAGLVIGIFDVGTALLMGAACSLLAVVFLSRLTGLTEVSSPVRASAIQQIAEGVRYAVSTPVVKMMMMINFSVAFFGLAFLNIGPGFGREVLGLGATETGLFIMAAGLGSITGSVGLVFHEVRDKNTFVVLATAGFGLALLALSINPWVPAAFLLMGLFGFSNATLSVTAQTIFQTVSSPHYLGRVISLWSLGGGIGALTALPIGFAGDVFGLRWSLGFVAAVLLLLSGYIAISALPLSKRMMKERAVPVTSEATHS